MTTKYITASVGRAGVNSKPDVRAVQCLLNLQRNMVQLNWKTKLPMSGVLDSATQSAITEFQVKVMRAAKPDGRVDAAGSTIQRLALALPTIPKGPFNDPAWLKAAWDEETLGVKEESGRAKNNPRILTYLETAAGLAKLDDKQTVKKPVIDKLTGKPKLDAQGKPVTQSVKEATGYKMSEVDETAWCACFVNFCLTQAGKTAQKGARADAYIRWGADAPRTRSGAITVIYREPMSDSASGYHIGFLVAGNPDDGCVALLGGNQNNSVCRKWYLGIEPSKIWTRWTP